MHRMSWDRLINDKRFGLEHYHDPKRGSRSDFQRDFDRLVSRPLSADSRIKLRYSHSRAASLCTTVSPTALK